MRKGQVAGQTGRRRAAAERRLGSTKPCVGTDKARQGGLATLTCDLDEAFLLLLLLLLIPLLAYALHPFLLSLIPPHHVTMLATPSLRQSAYIVAAKRTPFGAFGGKLSTLTAAQLGGYASRGALDVLPSGIEKEVKQTIFGNVHGSDNSAAYLARHVGHHAGLPVTVPALTVNRLCGSGFQSIINAVQDIATGDGDLLLTGGTESMSLAPYTLHGVRFGGGKYGVDLKLADSLAAALTDMVPTPTPMGITAENLAQKYGISRQQCDEFALQSQQRWQKANEEGAFKDEIVPVEVKVKKVSETVELGRRLP